MLKKMGWKPGQGIGPRLTYDQFLKRHEVDGTPLPSMEHEEARKHTYAPRDTAVPILKRKDDFGGLGYVPLAGLRAAKEVEGPKLSGEF
jgi:G patch domain-containing protein 1